MRCSLIVCVVDVLEVDLKCGFRCLEKFTTKIRWGIDVLRSARSPLGVFGS